MIIPINASTIVDTRMSASIAPGLLYIVVIDHDENAKDEVYKNPNRAPYLRPSLMFFALAQLRIRVIKSASTKLERMIDHHIISSAGLLAH